jgi:hypothetical protein
MKRIKGYVVVAGMFLTLNLWFACFAPSTWALESSLYKLTEQSSYLEGCYDPCMCPVFLNGTLQGSFMLTSVGQGEDGTLFEVVAIDWHFIMDEEVVSVTGSGYYWLESESHQLTLDLLVGDAPSQQFDSGLVPLLGEFPGIIIAVAENGFYCYDHVFDIKALPEPVGLSISSWGSLKSIYR